MSDLVFDRSINKLSWPAKGKTWSAVSGIVGRYDMLPRGEYWEATIGHPCFDLKPPIT